MTDGTNVDVIGYGDRKRALQLVQEAIETERYKLNN